MPASEDFAEMVCDGCMKKHPFLQTYAADTVAQSHGGRCFIVTIDGAAGLASSIIVLLHLSIVSSKYLFVRIHEYSYLKTYDVGNTKTVKLQA